ncbi:hypothetical protein J4230_04375 [Candidatus Woesearchaeota archaeon]|nr:hypothetical protein [Candidatus Woesearchaeota archaeon]
MKIRVKRFLALAQILLVISLMFVLGFTFSSASVSADEEQVCCEKDNDGNYCNYVPSSKCTGAGVLKASTSCDQTSFCKAGCCAGVNGFCYSNYAKALCEKGYSGSYSNDKNCDSVAECKLGCCIIGTQAAYLTRNRCIQETGKFPDLEVDFRESVNTEQDCLNLARNTEKGCCVTSDRKCKYDAKSECSVQDVVNGTGFYKDTYCSSLTNSCDCAPHKDGDPRATTCLANDDRVFWKDSCGNPEGVVEGINLKSYDKAAVLSDGKCDFNKGTLCGDSNKDGINVCESLDCEGGTGVASNNKLSLHMDNYVSKDGTRGTPLDVINEDGLLNGESWCEFDSSDQQQINRIDFLSTAGRGSKDPVGSRYYRHLCINGQELVEPCKDFREEYCYFNTINVGSNSGKSYTESRCISNQWKPCVNECNTANPQTMDRFTYTEALKKDQQCCLSSKRDCFWNSNKCVPAVSPGFKFWEGEGAEICAKANTQCAATFRCGGWNRIFGCGEEGTKAAGSVGGIVAGAAAGGYTALTLGATAAAAAGPVAIAVVGAALLIGLTSGLQGGWQIISGGECFSQDYLQAANNLCRAVGDCGADYNYLTSYADRDIDSNFTLGTTGFTNTKNVEGEIAEYAIKERDGKLQDTKSVSDRGNVEFTFKDGIPGVLTDPDWKKGEIFYKFNVKGRELGNMFVRALFTGNEVKEQGWLYSAASLSAATAVAGGVVGSIAWGVSGGLAAGVTGASLGLSASPLGYLVTKGLEFIPTQYTKNLGLAAGRNAFESAAKSQFETALPSIKTGALRPAVESSLKEQLGKGVSTKLSDAEILKLAKGEEIAGKIGKEVAGKVSKGAGEQFAKDQAARSFSGYLTGVSAALWLYTAYQLADVFFEDVRQVTISTTCQPWQPPSYKITEETDICERCNSQYNADDEGYVNKDKTPKDVRAFKKCSEYRCKSLGPSCELINKGTTEESCVSINKLDVSSPKIEPWIEGFTLGIKESDIVKNSNGFIIKKQKEIPIYTPFNIALRTDEPSQCKMSMEHSKRYNEMDNVFGNNIFKYFHINTMFYPANRNTTASGILLTGGGHYKLYLRCIDAVGNANENDYVVEFDVSSEPDLTAPTIFGSSLSPPVPNDLVNQTLLAKEVYLMSGANYTDITLFVNEPAECRYSYIPLDFGFMNETNLCKTQFNPPYYECKFIRGVQNLAGIGPAPSGFVSKPGLAQFVYFKCRDHPEASYNGTRNFNKDAYTVVLRGSETLHISRSGPSGTIKTSSAIVDVTLDVQTSGGALLNGKSICKYTTEEINKENLAAMTEFLNTDSSYHTQPWKPSSGAQRFFVGCYDQAGNRAFASISFAVEKDVTPPIIAKVYRDQSFQPPQFTVEINEPGECKDSVESIFNYDAEGNLMNAVGSSGRVFTSTVPNSNVYYIVCRDQFNNTMAPAIVQIAQV